MVEHVAARLFGIPCLDGSNDALVTAHQDRSVVHQLAQLLLVHEPEQLAADQDVYVKADHPIVRRRTDRVVQMARGSRELLRRPGARFRRERPVKMLSLGFSAPLGRQLRGKRVQFETHLIDLLVGEVELLQKLTRCLDGIVGIGPVDENATIWACPAFRNADQLEYSQGFPKYRTADVVLPDQVGFRAEPVSRSEALPANVVANAVNQRMGEFIAPEVKPLRIG